MQLKSNAPLVLSALGIVYGDVGTSPLYTLGTCFDNISINPANILGVISLIFWTLILVVSTCYLTVFLAASNDGEGGVLALLGLFKKHKKVYRYLFFIGIFGAGLLISDGMLTPAVSVMSAMEGLSVISPHFSIFIIPATITILLGLFFFQRFGTQKIGVTFGPILLIWFIAIGLMGLRQIIQHPLILAAVNPFYAIEFFKHNGFHGFLLLGSIFLCITGAEAMYADLGQFGKTPIRLGWFLVVLPGLILCFFGEGANLLAHPEALTSPFYLSAPSWSHYYLLILATLATIIASQSIISASYSLTKQGILLGVMPRLKVIQTSIKQTGQIYVPKINFIFAIGTIALVLFFKSSNALTSAYGIAINMEMVIMAMFVIYLAYEEWHWSLSKIIVTFALFVFIDLAFLIANLFKIPAGGWVPLVFAMLCLVIMITWHRGIELLQASFAHKMKKAPTALYYSTTESLHQLSNLEAILITNTYDQAGACFLQYFNNMQARPNHWLIVTVTIDPVPHIDKSKRYVFAESPANIHHLIIHFGFMETINVPHCLAEVNKKQLLPFNLNLKQSIYFIEDIALIHSNKKPNFTFEWQKNLFIFMFETTAGTVATMEFLKLPRAQTVMIGAYADI